MCMPAFSVRDSLFLQMIDNVVTLSAWSDGAVKGWMAQHDPAAAICDPYEPAFYYHPHSYVY